MRGNSGRRVFTFSDVIGIVSRIWSTDLASPCASALTASAKYSHGVFRSPSGFRCHRSGGTSRTASAMAAQLSANGGAVSDGNEVQHGNGRLSDVNGNSD